MTTRPQSMCAESRIGAVAAALTAVFCLLFTIGAVLTEARLLRAPWDVMLPIAPSLLLVPAFVAMMVCVNATVPAERRIWSQLGVTFACVYAPLCAAAYIVELFVVEPRVLRGAATQVALLTLVRGDSVFNAIDGIGYVFMCLATLLAAPSFFRTGLDRWIRWLIVGNGLLAIPIFLTYFVSRSFMLLAGLWCATITGSAVLLAIQFARGDRDGSTRTS
jgi:hypothetical protein